CSAAIAACSAYGPGPPRSAIGTSARDLRGLVEVLRLDEVVAAELRRWSDLAAAHADRGGRGGGLQRVAGAVVARRLDLAGELHVLAERLVALVLGQRAPGVLVLVDDQQVLHARNRSRKLVRAAAIRRSRAAGRPGR